MKTKIKLSKDRIIEAIKEGKELKTNLVLDINLDELSKEQRTLLSKFVYFQQDPLRSNEGEYFLRKSEKDCQFNSEDIKDILAELKDFEEVQKKWDERSSEISNLLEKYNGEDFNFNIISYTEPTKYCQSMYSFKIEGMKDGNKDFCSIKLDDGYEIIEQRINQLKQSIAKSIQQKIDYNLLCDEKQKKDELEKQKREQGWNELKKWAQENGSERLKLCVKYEKDWMQDASNEFALFKVKDSKYVFLLESQYDPEDEYTYSISKNCATEKLKILDKFKTENPDIECDLYGVYDNEDDKIDTILISTIQTLGFKVELITELSNVTDF